MECFLCKGTMTKGFTTHVADIGSCIIIVRNVPCIKCEQCGEIAYNGEVIRRLESIIDIFKTSLTEIAIINYSDKAA